MVLSKNSFCYLEQPRKFIGRFWLCVCARVYFPFCFCKMHIWISVLFCDTELQIVVKKGIDNFICNGQCLGGGVYVTVLDQ